MAEAVYFGAVLTLICYFIGIKINQFTKKAYFNPILIAIVLVVGVLIIGDIEYATYNESAKYISYLLTPATVSLAIPLYKQLQLLKDNIKAILIGVFIGVLTSMLSVATLSYAFALTHAEYVTFLPKSITTAIGIGVIEEFGGYVSIGVAAIIITGIIGNMIAVKTLSLFKITHPIAKGLAIGCSSHAIGTTKAMEIGEVEGAMSSLAIVVSGLMTVVLVSLFVGFI